MDVHQLTTALSGHDPDTNSVLDRLASKQRARRRRHGVLLGTGVLGVALLVSGTVTWSQWRAPERSDTVQAVSPPRSEEAPWTTPRKPVGAECGNEPLAALLARAHRDSASIIVAHGALADRTDRDVAGFRRIELRSVRTLAGPTIRDGATGWVPDVREPTEPQAPTNAAALWAPDGSLFAIAWPAAAGQTAPGAPLLWPAPLIRDQVIFNNDGCWNTTGIAGQPYTASTLAEIPGSGSFEAARSRGLTAVPLSVVQNIMPR